MRRVLRPAGRAGVAVWAEIEQCPPFAALESAIRQAAGRDIANRYRGGPWGLAGREALRELLERAGFEKVRVIERTLPVIFESGPEQLARTLAASGVAGELDALAAPDAERLKREVSERARGLMVGRELRSHMTSYLAIAYR
jgi:hypothetical protein